MPVAGREETQPSRDTGLRCSHGAGGLWGGVGWGGVGDAISVVWHRLRDRTHGDSGTDGLSSAFGCMSMALVVFGVGGGLKMQCAPACTFISPAV
jgi:hypothetical protein